MRVVAIRTTLDFDYGDEFEATINSNSEVVVSHDGYITRWNPRNFDVVSWIKGEDASMFDSYGTTQVSHHGCTYEVDSIIDEFQRRIKRLEFQVNLLLNAGRDDS